MRNSTKVRRLAHVEASERDSLMFSFHRQIERICKQHPDKSGFTDAVYAFVAFKLGIPKKLCHARQLKDRDLRVAIREMRRVDSRDVSEFLRSKRRRRR